MKRLFVILLILLAFGLCACNTQRVEVPVTTEPAATPPSAPTVSTTLMVYMIGSDLEAKAAAGTSDLEEISASGVDLTATNVLVYAGGTPYWHNNIVEENSNAILQLTGSGFQVVRTETAVSMGEPETLTEFLDYCYENYTTEQYALILWNHGNGPVMGYGKDLAFNGGSLLLSEMEQALEASVFGPENRLRFVGFDACLMASAELTCVWDDYADFLVASQEIEPSIGWNYSFVKNLSQPDTAAMLTALTEEYLRSCQDYYDEKGYDLRETTLSCVDLSKAAALEQAINNLFTQAADDVSLMYDKLSALRVNTRAFGRASTGSEYDLVDLGDMTTHLKDLYPEETAQLQQVLDQMIVANTTNTEICSGLSLYYPFYNKDYFYKSIKGADSWQNTYQDLALFPAYQLYLQRYQQIWNSTDRMDNYASSLSPTKHSGTYQLQLTEEQQSCYASCRYYILQRESAEMYRCLFVSSDVTNRDGVLEVNFDGNVIYVKDKYENYAMPVVQELDRIGNLSHYSIYVGLDKLIPDASYDLVEAGEDAREQSYRYHLALDKETGYLAVSALLPYDEDPESLTGGKLEDADLSQWASALFPDLDHRYLTRDDKGLIRPLDQWQKSEWFTGVEFFFADDIEFVYEPLRGGEFYLLLEIQDTQGSRYCSELLPIQVPEQDIPAYAYPQINVPWETGDRVLLIQENGVSVYMNMVHDLGKTRFTLELENSTDCGANLRATHLVCNDTIYCDEYFGYIHSEPGQSAWFSSLNNLGTAEQCGALENLTSISFKLYVRDEKTGAMLVEPKFFRIALSEQLTAAFREGCDLSGYVQTPFLGMQAERQVVYSDEDLQVTLLNLGTAERAYEWEDTDLYGLLQIENRSNKALNLSLEGLEVNQVYVNVTNDILKVPAGYTTYLEWKTQSFENMGISQISSLQLMMRVIHDYYVFTGFSETLWCPINLSAQGTNPESFQEADQVIYDKNGIRIALGAPEDYYGSTNWPLTIYNGTQYSVKATISDVSVNGTQSWFNYIDGAQAGPGQYGAGKLIFHTSMDEIQEVSFRIQIMDIHEESMLFTDEEVITLTLNTP